MKHSIKNIFRNISLFFTFATIFAFLGVLVAIDHTNSYKKIENLRNQKHTIALLAHLAPQDKESLLNHYNEKSRRLMDDIEQLYTIYAYNFTERFLLATSDTYFADLDKLHALAEEFNEKAAVYYKTKEQKSKREEMQKSFRTLYGHIDSIILKAITYNEAKFNIHKNVTYFAFMVIFAAALWYRRRLKAIYKDLEFLRDPHQKKHVVFSQEAETISLRQESEKKPALT